MLKTDPDSHYDPKDQERQSYLDAILPSPPDFEVLDRWPVMHSLGEVIPIGAATFTVVDIPANPAEHGIPRYLASAGFIDCVGVIGCIRDENGKPQKWQLSHLTTSLDPKASFDALVEAMRGTDTQIPIEYDLIGGDILHEDFPRDLIEVIKTTPNLRLRNNHLFRDDFKDEIAIDLHLGSIFGVIEAPPNELEAMTILFSQTALHDEGACREAFAQFDKRRFGLLPPNGLIAPVQFDWRSCIEEAKCNFTRFEQEILTQFRKEQRDPNWNFPSYFNQSTTSLQPNSPDDKPTPQKPDYAPDKVTASYNPRFSPRTNEA